MYIGNDVLQLLQSCVGEPASPIQIKHPRFPLSEFLYTVIVEGGEPQNQFSSLEHLSQLIIQDRLYESSFDRFLALV